ncbi:hypothetical protein ES288_A06G222300v1 [Gossypium darwinii]|uniref:Uncharacterized protein n=1 Tax=Gossypium darwinii TaxID=34276 RepID=A0A5D2GB93_GOSDA|nr:hypothetical protein ES288_A06G222300v1 [Gossypium darwinii]
MKINLKNSWLLLQILILNFSISLAYLSCRKQAHNHRQVNIEINKLKSIIETNQNPPHPRAIKHNPKHELALIETNQRFCKRRKGENTTVLDWFEMTN